MESNLSEADKHFIVCTAAVLAVGVFFAGRWAHNAGSRTAQRMRNGCFWRSPKQVDPADARYLENQVCKKKVLFAHLFCTFVAMLNTGGVVSISYLMWSGSRVHWMTTTTIWLVLIMTLLAILTSQLKGVINTGTLDLICFVTMLYGGILQSPWSLTMENVYLMGSLFFILATVPVCTFTKHFAVVFMAQTGLLALAVVRMATEESPPQGARFSSPKVFVLMHVCFLATVPLLFFFANNAIRQGVEARIRESDNKTQLDAASSLLELTCDAVVQLDSDFRVISESTPLATMLFRRATTLKGTKFTELVAPSESVRAEELLRDCGGEVRMANAFHTHLVDSNASKFRTEVFQVKYTKLNGQKCHVLGLRDFTDVEALSGRATDAIQGGPSSASVSSPEAGLSPSLENAVSESCMQVGKKSAFLQINVEENILVAASAPYGDLVGLALGEVFPHQFTVDMLRRLCAEAREFSQPLGQLPDRVASFVEMPFLGGEGTGPTVGITGMTKVVRTQWGQLHAIVSFLPPDPSVTGSCLEPRFRNKPWALKASL
ncbi:Nudix hydrolase 8 [Durusdinium trenchii]|uniref:Nudix hydrolase 8 n=1 Tax=Durusdinium trenchii TaxID=1381693 RepID=A0ABP0KRF6_9DINO